MKIAFTASESPLAQHALTTLSNTYGQASLDEADVIVALGGDGQVLRTLYAVIDKNKPVYAMRRTEYIGFLCNEYDVENLHDRLKQAKKITLHPLHLTAETADGRKQSVLAINEVSVMRETPQSARLRVVIDGVERINKYSGDGLLISTPTGSTAYNHSCGGPIMPLDANTLVITAISGFRPRGWRYAVLPQESVVEIEVLENIKRPVRIEAGENVIHNAAFAAITLDKRKNLTLMFDPDQHLGERIIREQFML